MTNTNIKPRPEPRNHRIVTPVPRPRPLRPPGLVNLDALALKLKREIEKALTNGFWSCQTCERMTEREEGEQGQPAHCARCGSPRIKWNPPVYEVLKLEVT